MVGTFRAQSAKFVKKKGSRGFSPRSIGRFMVPKEGNSNPTGPPPPPQDGVSDDKRCPPLRPLPALSGQGDSRRLPEHLRPHVRVCPRRQTDVRVPRQFPHRERIGTAISNRESQMPTVHCAFHFLLVQVLRTLLDLGDRESMRHSMSAIIFPRWQVSPPYMLFLRGFLPLGEPTSRGRT